MSAEFVENPKGCRMDCQRKHIKISTIELILLSIKHISCIKYYLGENNGVHMILLICDPPFNGRIY